MLTSRIEDNGAPKETRRELQDLFKSNQTYPVPLSFSYQRQILEEMLRFGDFLNLHIPTPIFMRFPTQPQEDEAAVTRP